MKPVKQIVLTTLATFPLWSLGSSAARADVTWEHSGSVRFGSTQKALVKFKTFTNVTPERMRLLFKYDATNALGTLPNSMPPGFPGMGGPMGSPMGAPVGSAMPMEALAPLKAPLNGGPKIKQMAAPAMDEMPVNPLIGSMTIVQRFDDQKFISYSSFSKEYVNETFKDILEKSRLDPWRKLAPKLSKEAPPSFTPEQRARLGAEVRAVVMPFMKTMVKTYFRPLTEKRTFDSMEGQGYRFTALFNTEPSFTGAGKWARLSAEWWIAGALPGDEVFGQLHSAALKTVGRDRQRSTSIWLNEMPWVMWEMLPEELHSAAYTLVPPMDTPEDSPEFQRAHMPLYAALTIEPPAGMAAKNEDLRIEMKLIRRGIGSLPAHIWEAPIGYKRKPIEDINKVFDQIMGAMPPMPFPGAPPM